MMNFDKEMGSGQVILAQSRYRIADCRLINAEGMTKLGLRVTCLRRH